MECKDARVSKGNKMELTERELSEIKLALFYKRECGHGTAGHNRLMLIAKMATGLGIELNGDTLVIPYSINIEDKRNDEG